MSDQSHALFAQRVPLPILVHQRATEQPDEIALTTVGDRSVTWQGLWTNANIWADWLRRAGVRSGDRVVTLVPQSNEAAYVWLACTEIGAVEVSVNTEFKGSWLAHALATSEARTVVLARRYQSRLNEVLDRCTNIQTILVYDSDGDLAESMRRGRSGDVIRPTRDVKVSEAACVLFTSGTTGRSKAVTIPWGQLYEMCTVDPLEEPSSEVFYVPYAPYHLSGRGALYRGAITGGHTVVREGFSTSDFWRDIRKYECTWTILYAATARFIEALPEADDDSDNPLRLVLMCPLLPEVDKLKERFGFRAYSAYGMTEIGTPLVIEPDGANAQNAGLCGRPVRGVEARLVDDDDHTVELGSPGELVLRSDQPWTFMTDYQGNAEATAHVWRNGWFHTGDMFVQDPDGSFRYIDRNKDMIRRRGENISSSELEAAAMSHPSVNAAAAVGIESEFGDEEILLAVILDRGETIDPKNLVDYLELHVPRFAVPKFIRLMNEFPTTQSTQRVRKSVMRTEGITEDTWVRPGRND